MSHSARTFRSAGRLLLAALPAACLFAAPLRAQSAAYRLFGQGCNGAAFSNQGVPALGRTFSLVLRHSVKPPALPLAVLHFGASATRLGPIKLPFKLDPFGLTGCTLYCSNELAVRPIPTLPQILVYKVAVPNDPKLLGVRFFNQFIVLDPHIKPIRWATSNAGEGLVGR